MQVVLEWAEIEKHLRRSLLLDGMKIPEDAEMVVRVNNKGRKQTVRLVFKTEASPGEDGT
jgi:hypothetical protein